MATLTTAQVATELNTDPRTLRKFLRADARANGTADSLPGKGSRYSLEKRSVPSLKKRFIAWTEANAPKVEVEVEAPEVD